MNEKQAPLSYVRRVMEELTRSGRTPTALDLHLHLGHWAGPPSREAMRGAQRRLDDELIALAQIEEGQSILDAGCGIGGTCASLEERFGRLELTGVNVDAEQLAFAQQAGRARGSRVTWLLADACALPLAAGSVDRVMAIECAFHFPSRRRFVAEARRVLREDGRVVLSDFVPRRPDDRAEAMRRWLDDGLGPWPDPFMSEGTWDELAKEVGLEVRTRIDATPAVLPTFEVILPPHAHDLREAERLDPITRAIAALGVALRESVLAMEYLVLAARRS